MLFLILWICFWFLSLASPCFVRNSYYLPFFLIKWISRALLPFGTILILKYDCFLFIFQFRHPSQMFHSLHSLLSFSTSTSAIARELSLGTTYFLYLCDSAVVPSRGSSDGLQPVGHASSSFLSESPGLDSLGVWPELRRTPLYKDPVLGLMFFCHCLENS